MTAIEMNAISAALNADCVLVVCRNCQEKADVTMLIQKLSNTANQSAMKVQLLNEKISLLEQGLTEIRNEVNKLSTMPKEEMLSDIKLLKEQVKEQHSVPARLTMAETIVQKLETTAITNDNQEWVQVVKNKAAPGRPAATWTT